MMMDDDELRQLYQQATVPPREEACPAAEDLLRLGLGQIPPEEREPLVDHLAGCSVCAASYRLARSVQPSAGVESSLDQDQRALPHAAALSSPPPPGLKPATEVLAPEVLVLRRGLPNGGGRVLVLAAAVVLAAGLTLAFLLPVTPWIEPAASLRGSDSAVVATEPESGAVLTAPPQVFRWTSKSLAGSVRVVLYDVEMTSLWDARSLTDAQARLPEELRSRLPAGRYYWRVIPEGGSRSEGSPVFAFDIRP
jgi:hypothetical protein